MNRLHEIKNLFDIEEIEKILKESTIFDKIEFSGITKESIKARIAELEEKVPNRTVLRDMTDEAVMEYWFKNWLHPQLKHAVTPSPRDKTGCSREILEKDMRRDFLRFYENGQQNFKYTLNDIREWLETDNEN